MKKLLLLICIIPVFANAQVKSMNAAGYGYQLSPSLSINNTTTETTVLSVTIPANTLATYKKVNYAMWCHLTSGLTAPTITIKVKYGTGVLAVLSGLSINLSQTNRPFTLHGILNNQNASNTQYCYGVATQNTLTGPLPLSSPNYDAYSTFTVDSTVDQVFTVTAQFGALNVGTTLVIDRWEVNGEL